MAQFYQIQKKDLSKDHAEITIPKRGKIAALFKVKMNTLFKHKNYTLFCGTYPAYTWEYPPLPLALTQLWQASFQVQNIID